MLRLASVLVQMGRAREGRELATEAKARLLEVATPRDDVLFEHIGEILGDR